MTVQTIYDLAFFRLPGEGYVMAALIGTGTQKVRGAYVRGWKSLAFGDERAILKEACRLAVLREEAKLVYKPKPNLPAEELIALIRKKISSAVPTGHAYDSPNKPRIRSFCLRVRSDAISAWKAQEPLQAETFLKLGPVERQPYEHVVMEKRFPPTMDGYLSWLECQTPAPFMEKFAIVTGDGEH
jgi:hypothetical protein